MEGGQTSRRLVILGLVLLVLICSTTTMLSGNSTTEYPEDKTMTDSRSHISGNTPSGGVTSPNYEQASSQHHHDGILDNVDNFRKNQESLVNEGRDFDRFIQQNVTSIATEKQTYQHFYNTLLIVMMSPSRYNLTDLVKRHYEKYYAKMVFVGPLPRNLTAPTVVYTSPGGIKVKGYDIVYGNEQYRAVRDVIREHVLERKMKYDGFLYVSDDLMLNPWTLVSRNMSMPWISHMGIANVKSPRTVNAVPGMSVQSGARNMWPYWRKNRGKLQRVLAEGGPELREALYQSAKSTHSKVYGWSKYPSTMRDPENLHNVIFYTIVDTYFIPFDMALKYADLCDLMAKHWVFGECAIATAVSALHPTYEQMSIQYYWVTTVAADCWRSKWAPWVNGFHRCRHDHPFTDLIFDGSDETRYKLINDRRFAGWAKGLHFERTKNKNWPP